MLLSKAKFVLRLVYFLLSRQIHNFVLNFKRKKFWILETDFVSRLEIIWQETKHSNATVSAVFNRENKIVARYLFLQLIRTYVFCWISCLIFSLRNFHCKIPEFLRGWWIYQAYYIIAQLSSAICLWQSFGANFPLENLNFPTCEMSFISVIRQNNVIYAYQLL